MEIDEVLNAIKVIRDCCKEYSCYNCPLRNSNGTCNVMNVMPDEWEIIDEPIRLFKK